MDLNLYMRVLWRFRLLVGCGLALAFVLALLSYVRIDFSGGSPSITYRTQEQWSSSATVFVTQQGFPLGRSIYDEVVPVGPGAADPSATSYVPRYADPSRFSSYAQLYARIVSSDLLKVQMLKKGPLPGTVTASPGVDARNPGIQLPLVEIQGLGATAADARAMATRSTRALIGFVSRQQAANNIDPSKRVILRVLNQAAPSVLVVPRTKTRPAFIFVAVLVACLALAFLLENMRPRVRAVRADEPRLAGTGESRRSA